MINLNIVEDNFNLRKALEEGINFLEDIHVTGSYSSGEEVIDACGSNTPDVILMDVQLSGELNGIQTAVSIRRDYPRLPIIFYSIQDDDQYYRDFQRSGILSHYAYVRKSNYLLPVMILPLIKDALAGRSFIDPDIEARVREVREKDAESPFILLEPQEKLVAELLAEGYTNDQIAERLGMKDKRSVSRINGQIYSAWGLDRSTTDDKVARTRAALIVASNRLLVWDDEGRPYYLDENGKRKDWVNNER